MELFSASIRSSQEAFGSRGRLRDLYTTIRMKNMVSINPGTTPDMNSWPMDSPVMAPYRIMGIDGGIRIPNVPPAATAPSTTVRS